MADRGIDYMEFLDHEKRTKFKEINEKKLSWIPTGVVVLLIFIPLYFFSSGKDIFFVISIIVISLFSIFYGLTGYWNLRKLELMIAELRKKKLQELDEKSKLWEIKTRPCPHCNEVVPDERKFCVSCGKKI